MNKWFIIPKPNRNAELRLFCFPYAGGSSTTYLPWVNDLPDNVELIIVQPPGRNNRMFEPMHSNMTDLVNELIPIIPRLLNKPYIFFGHSLGSRIAFELLTQLQMLNHPLPQHFIASGSRGAQVPSTKKPTHHLPHDEFIAELQDLNGTPQAVLENQELTELFLPLLRADFKISETYCYSGKMILDCKISVLSGEDDIDITLANLQSWGELFTEEVEIHYLSGGHFFIESHRENVLEIVNSIIAKYWRA